MDHTPVRTCPEGCHAQPVQHMGDDKQIRIVIAAGPCKRAKITQRGKGWTCVEPSPECALMRGPR